MKIRKKSVHPQGRYVQVAAAGQGEEVESSPRRCVRVGCGPGGGGGDCARSSSISPSSSASSATLYCVRYLSNASGSGKTSGLSLARMYGTLECCERPRDVRATVAGSLHVLWSASRSFELQPKHDEVMHMVDIDIYEMRIVSLQDHRYVFGAADYTCPFVY